MAKKINSGDVPRIKKSVLLEQENPTLTKSYQNNAPAPVTHLENSSSVASGDHDEVENENGDLDNVRSVVRANNAGDVGDIDDGALKPKMLTMRDIVDEMQRQQSPTPAEESKQKRMRMAMASIGALSDVGAGLANIFAAREGSIPVKHNDVTRELDDRYQRILDEKMRRNYKWDEMKARASMGDFSQRLAEERERAQLDASAKASELAYLREAEGDYRKHMFGVDKDNRKFNNGRVLLGEKNAHEMAKTKYVQGQANARNYTTIKARNNRGGDNNEEADLGFSK